VTVTAGGQRSVAPAVTMTVTVLTPASDETPASRVGTAAGDEVVTAGRSMAVPIGLVVLVVAADPVAVPRTLVEPETEALEETALPVSEGEAEDSVTLATDDDGSTVTEADPDTEADVERERTDSVRETVTESVVEVETTV